MVEELRAQIGASRVRVINNRKGWVGVDLDGTIAQYNGWVSPEHIGAPVPLMVARVKQWLADGVDVRIFTARVARQEREGIDVEAVRRMIEAWCVKHIGRVLPVTATKDFGMVALYDDRCIQVEPNTGRLIGDEGAA